MAIDRRELEGLIPSLRRYARGITGNTSAADDLVQDSLARALSRERQFRGENLSAWMFAILTNTARSDGRSRRRQPPTGPLVDAADAGADPASRVGILAALGSLADDQREALLLTAVEGFSYREAADILAVPIGTVMSRIARARDHLAERLDGASVVALRRAR